MTEGESNDEFVRSPRGRAGPRTYFNKDSTLYILPVFLLYVPSTSYSPS